MVKCGEIFMTSITSPQKKVGIACSFVSRIDGFKQ